MKILYFIVFLASISASSAITLSCTFYQDPFYYCEVSAITITSQDVSARTITIVNGIHAPGKSNTDVEALFSDGKTINYLFLGINAFFPNLKFVTVKRAKLLQLQASDLTQFPKATTLQFQNNQLVSIPSDLYSGTPLIENIYLTDNNITCIGSTAFNGLNLKSLYIYNNPCSSFSSSDTAVITSSLPSIYAGCACSTPTTPNPCIEASENQTIEFNNTIDSLKDFLTTRINVSLTNVCRVNNINNLNTRIQNLDNRLTPFINQTNSNFQNAFAVLSSVTSAINDLNNRLRTFRDATYARLDRLERCSCRGKRRDSSSRH